MHSSDNILQFLSKGPLCQFSTKKIVGSGVHWCFSAEKPFGMEENHQKIRVNHGIGKVFFPRSQRTPFNGKSLNKHYIVDIYGL